ncbi:cytochrome c oxidase subunit 3 [Pontibacter sp. BT310]|uniref:Cytochrome c oxidase subunit 3 n=1 Tax=Pontibacter populi TaxID=890055 RepID=A0ABS6X707_9BACT|nr:MULTISPECIES: cytochrome c oxidase subunit 3 [Pontibacter]MBJ6116920.1 cytochrome c oxidase subunit 3 [Pontibacter sp. BT310]MBR0569344.1 cytochrome c oxidase subunit 3 [Microvirga sp. STS03]MBW3363773.1 cytochrome c oxidase subunit 3 [Pontibacter populi]
MVTNIENQNSAGVHPLKFALWLIIISILMMFGAFTSAYIVRREEGNWLEFDLPQMFIINTAVIILSSITMQWAYFAAKKNNLSMVKIMLVLTMVLGIVFLYGQLSAWGDLVQNNVYFGGVDSNPAGSFLYVLTGVHGFHLITGLIFLAILLIASFKYKVHSKKMVRIQLCTTYWHFLGGLWLYLYFFLLVNH